MMGPAGVQRSFDRFRSDADVAVIESMGAVYDGENGTDRGSAAAMSKLLNVPIILVIDIWGMTRSAAALLGGFVAFDADVAFAGFVMNRAGSARHAAMVRDALPAALSDCCLGYVLHRNNLTIPERHLGLVTVEENQKNWQTRLVGFEAAGQALDVDRLMPPVRGECASPAGPEADRGQHQSDRVRIAIARDRAFGFYYRENLEALTDAGAELCPFNATSDPHLPVDVAGVYIGGGYPESFASALAANMTLKEELRRFGARGMPIYAECGGFMYLGQTLTDYSGERQSMVGLFPIDTLMDPEYLAIRYVTIRTLADSPLGPAGTEARGQEFHQSRLVGSVTGPSLYRVLASTGEEHDDGCLYERAAGGYVHLHFGSNLEIPRNFVESCRSWLERKAVID
jgi:cobyrinic acid a,c-diamide synthase